MKQAKERIMQAVFALCACVSILRFFRMGIRRGGRRTYKLCCNRLSCRRRISFRLYDGVRAARVVCHWFYYNEEKAVENGCQPWRAAHGAWALCQYMPALHTSGA